MNLTRFLNRRAARRLAKLRKPSETQRDRVKARARQLRNELGLPALGIFE